MSSNSPNPLSLPSPSPLHIPSASPQPSMIGHSPAGAGSFMGGKKSSKMIYFSLCVCFSYIKEKRSY